MKANYHTHTQRCRHAQGSEADYVREARKAGLEVLGFSDHAPFPDHDFGYRMPYEELDAYLEEVKRQAAEHAPDLMIHRGLEIEYLPWHHSYYEDLLTRRGLDYLLLGQHFFAEGKEAVFLSAAGDTEANLRYARSVREALKTGYFAMVAHPDLFAMNGFAWDRNCEEAMEIILDAALTTGTVLELNANGFRRGVQPYPDGERYMYPHRRFWEKAAEAGVDVIIGSDCHEACQVWDGCMGQAKDMLRELGIVPLEDLEDRMPRERG